MVGKQLGDYRLVELLQDGDFVTVWQAEQISMARVVELEMLNTRGDTVSFLENVRTKAVVEYPAIGLVYEAVESEEAVYYVRERLLGSSLEVLRDRGEELSTLRVLDVLEAVGGAIQYLEDNGFATEPLAASDIILSPHGPVRVVNRAVIGSPSVEVAWHDRDLLAGVLKKLLRPDDPGSTRTGRLLNYLSERDEDAVSWLQVVNTAKKVRGDLISEQRMAQQPDELETRSAGGILKGLGVIIVLVIFLGLGLLFFQAGDKEKEPEVERVLVSIPAGTYPGRAGATVSVGELWVESGEVTIASYGKFLRALQVISEGSRNVYDHPDQPERKIGHEPSDWAEVWVAAQVGGSWEGRMMRFSSPVVNVDWWDAHAYANWAGGRLPTEKEWTALRRGTLPGWSDWGPVTGSREDLANGVHGLAGNVMEWARDLERNPMFPMQSKRPVACGGSFLHPGEGVHAREWLRDRGVRRPDLGFRVVYEEATEAP